MGLSVHEGVGDGGMRGHEGGGGQRRQGKARSGKVTVGLVGEVGRMGGLEELAAVRCRGAGEAGWGSGWRERQV